jgi:hypothetical protein
MTRTTLASTALGAATLSVALWGATFANAQTAPVPAETVARTFMAATQSQDRQAALKLLDERVSISFADQAAQGGHGEGQPFVIGYLDGLFYGQRAVSVEGGADAQGAMLKGATVRFMAHDARHDHYAIDVEVKNARVVRVTVRQQPQASVGQAVASLDPS